jgi:2,4-dienoyl-CoA reductase (NADPH2)
MSRASPTLDVDEWRREWGVTDPALAAGGLARPVVQAALREVYLLQRKATGVGRGLGKTTGWVHRAALKAKGVQQLGVDYERIDDDGLHITFDEERSGARVLDVDTIVVCAGQESVKALGEALRGMGVTTATLSGWPRLTDWR